MSICIGMFEFDGPYMHSQDILPAPGVYAVLHHDENANKFALIQAGQGQSLASCARRLDLESMQKKFNGQIALAVFYTNISDTGRFSIVKTVKKEFQSRARVQMQSAEQFAHVPTFG